MDCNWFVLSIKGNCWHRLNCNTLQAPKRTVMNIYSVKLIERKKKNNGKHFLAYSPHIHRHTRASAISLSLNNWKCTTFIIDFQRKYVKACVKCTHTHTSAQIHINMQVCIIFPLHSFVCDYCMYVRVQSVIVVLVRLSSHSIALVYIEFVKWYVRIVVNIYTYTFVWTTTLCSFHFIYFLHLIADFGWFCWLFFLFLRFISISHVWVWWDCLCIHSFFPFHLIAHMHVVHTKNCVKCATRWLNYGDNSISEQNNNKLAKIAYFACGDLFLLLVFSSNVFAGT